MKKIEEKLQILVSTMNQDDKSLIKRMNIHSDAIIINQTDSFSKETWNENGNNFEWYNLEERGGGLSRNNALLRATGNILLFADDDVRYIDNYEKIIQTEFEKRKDAELILFNVESTNKNRPEYIDQKFHKVHFYNYLRYGTFRIAVKKNSIRKHNISFSLLFGGGSKYSSGEDSLFLTECLKKNMKIYASEQQIGYVDHRESTWFKNYDEKYFYDKGALFSAISRRFSMALCLQYCIRHKDVCKELGLKQAYKSMLKGLREYERW